jgi:hypothetical protein
LPASLTARSTGALGQVAPHCCLTHRCETSWLACWRDMPAVLHHPARSSPAASLTLPDVCLSPAGGPVTALPSVPRPTATRLSMTDVAAPAAGSPGSLAVSSFTFSLANNSSSKHFRQGAMAGLAWPGVGGWLLARLLASPVLPWRTLPRRFKWPEHPQLRFSPAVGHLHAGCSKEVAVTFAAAAPVRLEGQDIRLALSQITYKVGRRMGLPTGGW